MHKYHWTLSIAERLRWMLEDSAPAVLLTQGDLEGLFSRVSEKLPVIDLTNGDLWSSQPDNNLDPSAIGLTPKHLV